MKFSEQWLRDTIQLDISQAELISQLTMAGLEVDDASPVAGEFTGVVVGEVMACEQHPNADKLSVCKVAAGEEELLDIVCGAKNVRTGLKVACAKVGAVLGGDFKIKKAKLRGAPSHGMLCSASELGFAESSDGIIELPADAPVGEDIRQYLHLDDAIIDVDLTPNRGDCLSIEGIARELATINRVELEDKTINPVAAQSDRVFPVHIHAAEQCPHYVGRVIEGVDLKASSPIWLQERLRRSGMRSIDPVVDVTNYVMLELGQPLHAFDLATLSNGIDVRMARADERMTLLDGNEINLNEDCLLIADDSKILALAGVMGAENSGVSESTQSIFLESAFFSPKAIAGRARSFGLHTESSHRYERGVSPNLQVRAIERATELLLALVGGTPGPLIEKTEEAHLPSKSLIQLRSKRIQQVLGIQISDDDVLNILQGLGMTVYSQGDKWEVQVPLRRFDITIEEDLIEELARIYGYNQIPAILPRDQLSMRPVSESQVFQGQIKQCLLEQGYSEAITYSFIDPKWQAHFVSEMNSPALVNPLSPELSQMRQSLWPALVQTVQYNQNRQQETLRFFESGLRFFFENGTIQQQRVIAGVACGQAVPEQWGVARRDVDFFDVKADVESVLALTADKAGFSFVAEAHTALHPGQSAKILRGDQVVGWMGAVHPKIETDLDLDGPIYVFELYYDGLEAAVLPKFEALSKFPAIRRDLALVADDKIPAGEILQQIRNSGEDLVKEVSLFDVYQGPGVAEGKRSLALSLTLQHGSRTLIDQDVSSLIENVVQSLHDKFGVTLRE